MRIQTIVIILLATIFLVATLFFVRYENSKLERWVAYGVKTEWGNSTIELVLYKHQRFTLKLTFDGESRSQKEEGRYIAKNSEIVLIYSSGHMRRLSRLGDTLIDAEETPNVLLTRVR